MSDEIKKPRVGTIIAVNGTPCIVVKSKLNTKPAFPEMTTTCRVLDGDVLLAAVTEPCLNGTDK